MNLRDYQEKQYDFIVNKMKLPGGGVFGIESPTGSGKTIVMLKYLSALFNNKTFMNKGGFDICITTGTNNLVFQIEKTLRENGLDPIVIIGRGAVICRKKIEEAGLKRPNTVFDFWSKYRINLKDCKNCSCSCYYDELIRTIKIPSSKPRIIITNHSMYLILMSLYGFNPKICFVDEAHTFLSFYQNFNNVELKKKDIEMIEDILERSSNNMIIDIFKNSINKGISIHPNFMTKINKFLSDELKSSKDNKDMYNFFYISEIMRKLELFTTRKDNFISEFLDNSMESKSITLVKFFNRYEINQNDIKYCLMSATLDKYSLDLFDVINPRQDIYIEKTKIIDYTKSKLIVSDEDCFVALPSYLANDFHNEKKGLLLSTTNKLVEDVYKMGIISGYRIYKNVVQFINSPEDEKSLLVGSRALFQGIDIPGLDFVILNTIPFQRYDLRYKRNCLFINSQFKNGRKRDAWTDFTIPLLKNDLTQTTGRLWRTPTSKGTIVIFDGRLINRFSNLINHIESERFGIKTEIRESNKDTKI